MSQEHSGGMSATSVILIVLACVGVGVLVCAGVIVVCLVAITALGTSANATFGTVGSRIGGPELQPEDAAQTFAHDLCAGLTQTTWDRTSADFQNRHRKVGGPDQSKFFADFLQEHPQLRNPSDIEVDTQSFNLSQASVQATITPRSGEKIILNLKLTKEMGTWKVSDLSVSEEKKDKGDGPKKQTPRKDGGKDKG